MNERTNTDPVVRFAADAGAERAGAPGVSVTPGPLDMTETIDPTEREAETDQIREEIEQTRSDLSETINAIQDKLNPQHLVEQAKEAAHDAAVDVVDGAKDTVRAATIGKVEQMVSSVTETTKGLVGGTDAAPSGATPNSSSLSSGRGAAIMETVRQNPVPAALAAFGLGWLWTHRTQAPASAGIAGTVRYQPSYQSQVTRPDGGSVLSDTASRIGDSAGQVVSQAHGVLTQTASQAHDTVGQLAGQATETAQGLIAGTQVQAQQAQSHVQRLWQENPLALGAAGVALGVAVGLVLPETSLESHLLGEARDSLMDKAQETAQSTLQKVQSAAQEAGQAAQSAAQQQGLTS